MKRTRALKGAKLHILKDRIGRTRVADDGLDHDARYSVKLRELRPTPLEGLAHAEPIELRPVPKRKWWRAFWCLGIVLRFLGGRWLTKARGHLDVERDAANTRLLFERLGGMWIKLGQLLSLRNDLFSDAMCRELAALQYKMRGFPEAVALQVLREDLGEPPARIFSRFDTLPFAAASICQVHRAVLAKNGRAVVVKIMRPDVRQGFISDLKVLGFLMYNLKLLGLGSRLRLDEGVRELRSLLREETDYSYEVVNLKRMRKSLRVRPETLWRITEFSEHESNGRELDEGERVAVEVLPVLGQSAAAVEPGDGAFDHPTPGLDDEALHPIGSLDDLGLEIGQDAGQGRGERHGP